HPASRGRPGGVRMRVHGPARTGSAHRQLPPEAAHGRGPPDPREAANVRVLRDPTGRDGPSAPARGAGDRRSGGVMDRRLARSLVAEAIGTFALVFAGCGAIMVDAKTHALGHVGVAVTFGLVIMFGVYAVGHISGAHFNAAVTFAFALTRHFPWPRALAYWAAQLVGALCAAALLRGSLGNIAHVGATLPSGSQGQA